MTTEEMIDELLHAGPCSYGCSGELSRKVALKVIAKLRAAEELADFCERASKKNQIDPYKFDKRIAAFRAAGKEHV